MMLLEILVFSVFSCGVSCARNDDYYGPQTFENRQTQPTHYNEPDSPRPPPPAILSHKQGLTNDGTFNYIFTAENGLKQGESIAPDGTRTGAYQYVDPSGKTVFVKYSAGKDGFRILEGDHVPRQPEPIQPIDEYQPPEYRKDYKQPEQQEYEQPEQRYQQQKQQPNQRYTTPPKQQYKPQAQLFQPYQEQQPQQQQQQQPIQYRPQGGQGGQGKPVGRPMLYNVEQRHSANYRKYQDNGQLASADYDGSPAPVQENAPHSFGGGYNFEFKG